MAEKKEFERNGENHGYLKPEGLVPLPRFDKDTFRIRIASFRYFCAHRQASCRDALCCGYVTSDASCVSIYVGGAK